MSNKVTKWLEQQGLGQFAPVFIEEQIDWEILSELNENDLEKLHIPLGPRKKIIKAITALDEKTPDSPEAAQSFHAETDASSAAWERLPGERKPVTMLFADITGSTALTEKLDSEETHDLLYGATRCMCEAVEENGGVVCRFMGDGIMAMFGAPVASEHHAINGCLAALGMQQSIRQYSDGIEARHGSSIEIRVGLHSGEVVVLTVGDGDKIEYDASGPTVPIAARLEQSAEPGEINMSASTHRLMGGRADVGALGEISVKGISEPVSTYVLRRVRSEEESTSEGTSTPFVGRRAEFAQFRALMETCLESGRGQAVFIRGEPGIGKSRLVEELAALAKSQGVDCHRGLVLDFGVGRGEDAIRTLVRSLLNIPSGSGEAMRNAAAEAAIGDGFLDVSQRAFINDLLDLPQPVELGALYDALYNDTRNQGKQKVVTDLLTERASHQPLIAVVEDVHWADPLTLAHLAAVAAISRDCAALLVMTSRSDGDPLDAAWRGAAGDVALITLDLGPLRIEEAREMAATSIDVTSELVQSCIERSGCNPLFLEHLLHSATDSDLAAELPTSLQTLVAARVDRLESLDKRAVRAAAVLGQRFHEDALRHLIETPGFDCGSLVTHRLVRPDGDSFLFSHALVQEAVLSSLLRKERRILHRRAADWYAESDSTLHAQHLDRAEDPGASLAYLEAARAQMALFHFGRASSLISRGIELAANEDDTHAALREVEGSVRIGLGETREAVGAFEKAAALANDPHDRSRALIGVAHCFRDLGEYGRGLEILQRAHDEVARLDLTAPLSEIHHYRGNIFFLLYDHERCLDEQNLALDLARRSGSKELEAHAFAGLARASFVAGRMRSGSRYAREGCLELCRREGLERIEFTYMHMAGIGPFFDNDHETALEYNLGGVEKASSVGAHRSALIANAFAGELFLERGEWDAARERSEESERLGTLIGERRYLPFVRGTLGLILMAQGERSRAENELEQAWELCDSADMGYHGLVLIGAIARATTNPERRRWALEQGDRVAAAACNGQSRIRFFRDAMEATLAVGEWDDAERHALRLEKVTRAEPLAYSKFFISRARALAAFGRGKRDDLLMEQLRKLHSEARRVGLVSAMPLLSEALAGSL